MKLTTLLIPLMALAVAGVLYSSLLGSAESEMLTGDLVAAASEAQQVMAEKLSGVTRDVDRVQLSDAELRSLVLASLIQHPGGQKILRNADGFGARLVDGKLEVRLVVNVARMRAALSPEERELFDRAVATARMAENMDVTLALEGMPTTAAGGLALPPGDTKLKLSLLALDLVTWAERVGYKRRDIERLLQFRLPGFRVTGASVGEDGVELAIRRV